MVVLTWVLFVGVVVMVVPCVFGVLHDLYDEFRSDWKPQVWDEDEIRERLDRNTDWDND